MPLLTINLRFSGLTYDSALLVLIHFCYDCVTCPCVAVGLDCLYCRFLLGCSHLSACLLAVYACPVVSESDGSFFSELLGSYSLAMPLSYFDFEVAVEPDDSPHRSRLVSREQAVSALCDPMCWLVQSFWPDRSSATMVSKWVAYWESVRAMRENSPGGGALMLGSNETGDLFIQRQQDAWSALPLRLQKLLFYVRGPFAGTRECEDGGYVAVYDPWMVRLRRVNDYVSLASAYLNLSFSVDRDSEQAIVLKLSARLSRAWSRLSRPERVVVMSRSEFWQLPESMQPVLLSREQRRPRPTKAIRARKRDWGRVRPDSGDVVEDIVWSLDLEDYVAAAAGSGAKVFRYWHTLMSDAGTLRRCEIVAVVSKWLSNGDQEFIYTCWRGRNKFERMESARRYLRGRPLRGSALWRQLTSYYRRQLQSWLSAYDRYQADVEARGGRQDPPLDWRDPVFTWRGKLLGHLPQGEYGFYVPASLVVPVPRS